MGRPLFSRRELLVSSAALAAGAMVRIAPAASPEPHGWPSHGYGPRQHRHNTRESIVSPETVSRLRLAWRFEAGSGITTTPAIAGDRVVVGSWDGSVYALALRTGKLLWKADVGTRLYPPDRRLGVYASPAVAGGTVYVASDRIVALALGDGRVRWERTIGEPAKTLEYFWAPPLVHAGRLYAGVSAGSETRTRGRIVCLDASTGEVRWTFFTVAEDVAGGALVAPPSLDPRTGTLYAATGNPFHVRPGPLAHSDSLLALEAATGRLLWADQVHPHDTRNLDLNCPPVLLTVRRDGERRRLVLVGGKDGLRAWDRESRKRLWHVQLAPAIPPGEDEALPTSGPEAGPLAAAGGLVFFASNNHADGTSILAAVDPADGALRWMHCLPAFQSAPMSVAGGVVFLGLVDGVLRAWRVADGKLLWESPKNDPIAGGPAIAGGHVIVGTGAGSFLPGRTLLAFAPKERT